MFFNIVSIFPEIITDYIQHGLFSKALQKDLVQLKTWNPREFSKDKNGRIDDKPFGGGRGMLFQAEPIINTVEEIKKQSDTHVVLVSPHGVPFNQEKAKELQSKNNVTIVCGRYEGIDYRFENYYVDEVISVGDYVLNGGELPALVIVESIARLVEGFIGHKDSLEDSFTNGLLEHPQFTRPEKSEFGDVPEILLSGDHKKISRWKLKESLRATLLNRPDLIEKRTLTELEEELIIEIKDE